MYEGNGRGSIPLFGANEEKRVDGFSRIDTGEGGAGNEGVVL